MSALALSALSGSAYADSIQNIFSSYAPPQQMYAGQQQAAPVAPPAPAAAPAQAYIPQRGLFTSSQPAQMSYVPPPPSPPNGGGFFAALFGHSFGAPAVYQPATPDYQSQPQDGVAAAYAPSSQGDMANPQNYQIDPQYERQVVDYRTSEQPGTIVIDTPDKFLYLVEGGGKALRYGIGVGRPGFTWSGVKTITAKREWPDWRPPSDMLARRPDLPRFMPGGEDNPLGARAMYLGSTLYRIHGSNEPWTIGTNVSSGCIRMRNEDVEDLYGRVKVGTKVVVI
ncbi:MAG TPA: L,D-transpeptidase [Xanthobacteraceae bacterium]|nr:L,D-transpeptidase [Xanthobacteraceae bacterium]